MSVLAIVTIIVQNLQELFEAVSRCNLMMTLTCLLHTYKCELYHSHFTAYFRFSFEVCIFGIQPFGFHLESNNLKFNFFRQENLFGCY